jgi:hypothetical protein
MAERSMSDGPKGVDVVGAGLSVLRRMPILRTLRVNRAKEGPARRWLSIVLPEQREQRARAQQYEDRGRTPVGGAGGLVSSPFSHAPCRSSWTNWCNSVAYFGPFMGTPVRGPPEGELRRTDKGRVRRILLPRTPRVNKASGGARPVLAHVPNPTAASPYETQCAWHLDGGDRSTYLSLITHPGDARVTAVR